MQAAPSRGAGDHDMTKLEHLGSRIRLFRKHRNLTLEELAYMVHKSPSTISKYEKGTVNIDILTLSEIADSLEVDIGQLTDFQPIVKAKPLGSSSNFFTRHRKLYAYYNYRPWKVPMQGTLEITGTGEDECVVLSLGMSDPDDNFDPLFLYSGTIHSDDNFTFMELYNVSGMKDKVYCIAKSPYWLKGSVRGLFLSVSQTYGCPSLSLFLFSAEKRLIDESLIEDLNILDDETKALVDSTNLILQLK